MSDREQFRPDPVGGAARGRAADRLRHAGGRVTLTAKLKLRRKTLASSARHTVRAGRVKLVLKTKKRLKKGRYTLSVRIAQGVRSATLTRTLKLR